MARALAVDGDSRAYAVKLREAASATADVERQNRIAAALKEVGGEQAFESVSSILQARYIEPSDRLQTVSEGIFKDPIERMRSNHDTAIRRNRIVFWLGFGVIVAGVVTAIIDPESQFFGAAAVVSGLGTLVSLFFFGPIGRMQMALESLELVEVSFCFELSVVRASEPGSGSSGRVARYRCPGLSLTRIRRRFVTGSVSFARSSTPSIAQKGRPAFRQAS